MPPGETDHTKSREIATLTVRLIFFGLTLAPLGAFLLPWITLDGTWDTHTGISTIALFASPLRTYLFEVSLAQAAILATGPVLIVLLATFTSYRYHRRKSICWAWAPLTMLAAAIAVSYATADLVHATHSGLVVVMVVAVLLTLHQAAIRAQVSLRRRARMPSIYHGLAIATGNGYYRWNET